MLNNVIIFLGENFIEMKSIISYERQHYNSFQINSNGEIVKKVMSLKMFARSGAPILFFLNKKMHRFEICNKFIGHGLQHLEYAFIQIYCSRKARVFCHQFMEKR